MGRTRTDGPHEFEPSKFDCSCTVTNHIIISNKRYEVSVRMSWNSKTLQTDNGPQYSSYEFNTFCKQYGIEHETSSPHFQSSNGEAERAIQTDKRL